MEIGKTFCDVQTDTPEFQSTRSSVGDDLKMGIWGRVLVSEHFFLIS